NALGGSIRNGGKYVAAPCPGARRGKRDRSALVFINGEDIGVHLCRPGDAVAVKDEFSSRLGLPSFEPRQKAQPKPTPPLSVRVQFPGEFLRLAQRRRRMDAKHFGVLVNDLKNIDQEPAEVARRAAEIAQRFGISDADLNRFLGLAWRPYTAAERAEIW